MAERDYLLVRESKGGFGPPFLISNGSVMEGYIVLFGLCGAFWILFNA